MAPRLCTRRQQAATRTSWNRCWPTGPTVNAKKWEHPVSPPCVVKLGGSTPLHFAAEQGHQAVVALLLAHQADVHAKDDRGSTPLHLAARKGHRDVAELLLAHHAKVQCQGQ